MLLRSLLAHVVSIAHLAFVAFILTRATPTSALLLSSVHSMPPAVATTRASSHKEVAGLSRAFCDEEACSHCGAEARELVYFHSPSCS